MRWGTSLELQAGQGILNINPKFVAAADASAAPEPPPAAIVDPLADALLYLAAHHGRALSRDALLAGLPIDDGRLNVALFERAAQRAGLETEPVKRALLDIPALVLPAVLIMRDGSCRVLLELDTHAGTASVIDPSEPQARPQTSSASELSAAYLGYAFFARPALAPEARASAAGDIPQPHWFWSVVVGSAATTATWLLLACW